MKMYKTKGFKCLNCGKIKDCESHLTSCRCELCDGDILQHKWLEHNKVCPSKCEAPEDDGHENEAPEDNGHEDEAQNEESEDYDVGTEDGNDQVVSNDIKNVTLIDTMKKERITSIIEKIKISKITDKLKKFEENTKSLTKKDMEEFEKNMEELRSKLPKIQTKDKSMEENEFKFQCNKTVEEKTIVFREFRNNSECKNYKDVIKVLERDAGESADILKFIGNVIETGKKIDVLEYKTHIMWKVEKFNENINNGKNENYILFSLPVFTSSKEYKFSLSVHLSWSKRRRDEYYMTVNINILRSPYNDVLQWPMKRKVILTLLHPQDGKSNFYKSFYCNFEKPIHNQNERKHVIGIANFMPLAGMYEYIFDDDCVKIKCELAEYPEKSI